MWEEDKPKLDYLDKQVLIAMDQFLGPYMEGQVYSRWAKYNPFLPILLWLWLMRSVWQYYRNGNNRKG